MSSFHKRRLEKSRCCPAPWLAFLGGLVVWLGMMTAGQSRGAEERLVILPEEVRLESPEASVQLVILKYSASGGIEDVTRRAKVVLGHRQIASINSEGQVLPLQDGATELTVEWQGRSARRTVRVQGQASPPPVSFRRDISPLLTKAGCNAGGCHGKAEGQNGFKLSVFGFDPVADHRALVMEGRGRRIFPASPENSLLRRKAVALVPHGGGRKIEPDSRWDRLLQRWLREGAEIDREATDSSIGIRVEPSDVVLAKYGSQQLRVSLLGGDGSVRCVTAEAEFQTNQEVIAGVDRGGLIRATEVPGEAAILVRYAGHVGVCRVTRPQELAVPARPPEHNFIDRLVWDKLQRLRIGASPLADDATFLRRVSLDTIGTLPTPEEVRHFLADASPDKRSRLVDRWLDRPEYADYWAQRWSDLLQVDKDTITPQGTVAMTRWLRRQFAANVPLDRMVSELLTSQGSTLHESPAAFFQVQGDAERAARSISQLFLGVRIECAQCHHHPFERWDQKDYYAFAGFFTGLDRRNHPRGGTKIVAGPGSDLKHPRTGQMVPAAGLGAPAAVLPAGGDRRVVLANWLVSQDNPYFARAVANRLWAHYFGRGLVEPVDDLRATNPATNEELLAALAAHLVQVRFDVKAFTRTLLQSRTYQLSADASDSNALDEQNYSHASWKPIPAEVLLDAVSQATGVSEEFNGWPRGYRAIQIWDNKLPSHFLEVFGRPRRQTVCACERGVEPSIAQALHLMNSAETVRKIQHRDGIAARLANSNLTPEDLIATLYLGTMSRFPSAAELKLLLPAFAASGHRRTAAEDVLWTLLNTREFVFNH